MSTYGEPPTQFRTRPAAIVILAFTFLASVVGAAIGPLLFSLARSMVTRALRPDYVLNLHAPIAANPSLGLFPMHSEFIVIGGFAAAGVVALLPALFVALYPASQTLATRLAINSIATAVLATGAAATLADTPLVRSLARWKEMPEPASGAVVAGAFLVVILLVVWLERRTISLLGNLFPIDNPGRRLLLWALRVPLPWIAFGAVCWAGRWWGGVIAAAGVIAVTLVDDLVHFPALRYESLERPKMHEGLVGVAIAALLLGSASAWTFGHPLTGIRSRAVVVEDGKASRVLVSDLTNRIQEDTMPRIEMKWSEEK